MSPYLTPSACPEPPASSQPVGVIASAAYRNGVRVGDVPLCELAKARDNTDWFLWVGLHEPGEDILEIVQKAFGLHDLAIEDAHKAHQRPKLEAYGDALFVVLRTARLIEEEDRIEFGETHIFAGDRYLVSVRHGSRITHLGVRARCEASPDLLARGPGYVLYALMDFVVDHYFPVVEQLETELQELEARIFGDRFDREATPRIYRLKRNLLVLKRAITPLVGITGHLMRDPSPLIPAEARVFFQDINDHVLRLAEIIDSLQELSSTALAANLSLLSLSQNQDTRKLAAWAAIIAVPTMLAGLYGMNFEKMPELKWDYGYPLAVGLMAALCLLLYRGVRRSGWL
jgi:magnesium transporter